MTLTKPHLAPAGVMSHEHVHWQKGTCTVHTSVSTMVQGTVHFIQLIILLNTDLLGNFRNVATLIVKGDSGSLQFLWGFYDGWHEEQKIFKCWL